MVQVPNTWMARTALHSVAVWLADAPARVTQRVMLCLLLVLRCLSVLQVRVELSGEQRELYKAILGKNYDSLTGESAALPTAFVLACAAQAPPSLGLCGTPAMSPTGSLLLVRAWWCLAMANCGLTFYIAVTVLTRSHGQVSRHCASAQRHDGASQSGQPPFAAWAGLGHTSVQAGCRDTQGAGSGSTQRKRWA